MKHDLMRARDARLDLWAQVIESLAKNMRISKREAAELIAAECRAAAKRYQRQEDLGLPVEQFGEIPPNL